jgi:hypothetical protein
MIEMENRLTIARGEGAEEDKGMFVVMEQY